MNVKDFSLPGLKLLTPQVFGDHRGSFCETWNRRAFAEAGIDVDFVQENRSVSAAVNTLRGLHFQSPPDAQAKLVSCLRGRIWDVAVDIRRGSPTFGRWEGVEMSAASGAQLFVPVGFLHGFVTLEPDTMVTYKCSAFYAPGSDGSVLWSSCGIDWPFRGEPVLSAKDIGATPFDRFESPFVLEAAA